MSRSTKNIILFGQTGAGKTSIVDLMTGQETAKTTLGMDRYAFHSEEHSITFDGYNYKVFEIIGLEELQIGRKEYLDAVVSAYNLTTQLENAGGIDLLLFCVRAGRFTSIIRSNYQLFYECLCEKKIPIILVLTGLETEQIMDNWWTRYRSTFEKYGIVVNDHACITTINRQDGRHQRLYAESRRLVCDLVIQHSHGTGHQVACDRDNRCKGDGWSTKLTCKLKELLPGSYIPKKKDIISVLTKRYNMSQETAKPLASKIRQDLVKATSQSICMSTKNIVIFGETGAGKSSVVNLMAGQEMAKTSPGTERCTLQWEAYSISFGEHSYKVFDTIGLEDDNLRKEEYLDAIVNAHNLIAKLDNEGGIDLLLFCVRAGRVTTTLQINYRLFYEWLCEKKVPIILVLTGLERETNMEDWWTRNQRTMSKYGISVAGHACITAAKNLDGKALLLYEESRRLVRELVIRHTYGVEGNAYKGGSAWFRRVMQKLWGSTLGNFGFKPDRGDIVTILTNRCYMPPDRARGLASRIRSDLGGNPFSPLLGQQTVDRQ